jgi:tRNA-splicing ligase RtcB
MNKFIKMGDAHYRINKDLAGSKKIDIFATEPIVNELSDSTIKQACNTAMTPGVDKINLNADAHEGYGCPIGSVVATRNTIMPGPIGYDISCSMSYLQTDLPAEELKTKEARRNIINRLTDYIPQGAGSKMAPEQINIDHKTFLEILEKGASDKELIKKLGIEPSWVENLERTHLPADPGGLSAKTLKRGENQSGSLGGGNHFLEAQKVDIIDPEISNAWGINNNTGILTHCGSRGLGHQIATEYFEILWKYTQEKYPDFKNKDLVFADVESAIGRKYLLSMGCAANFAIVNHLLINSAIYSALMDIYPSVKCHLVYHISHNLAQKEKISNKEFYIHRKGATRAFPPEHPALEGTKFFATGHPVIIPGSSLTGSSIMAGVKGNEKNFYSTPHGSGRTMSRRAAKKKLSQAYVNEKMDEAGVLFNKRNYPVDEFAETYKDYDEVIKSVVMAGLAREVADLKPLFVIKGD